MGRRKFKLETRKNAERKKYNQKQREEVKLVVSVSRLVYLSTPAPDIHVLYRRLTCSDITSGWSCKSLLVNSFRNILYHCQFSMIYIFSLRWETTAFVI